MRRRIERKILSEEIDEEVLKRMPEWFKRLREAYIKKKSHRKTYAEETK